MQAAWPAAAGTSHPASALLLSQCICTPPSLSCGCGIFVTGSLHDIDTQALLLVQRSITTPLLLDGDSWLTPGHKFDLRLPVLLSSSVESLEGAVHREAFAPHQHSARHQWHRQCR